MVLRSMPTPAWLDRSAPGADVVVSSRVRYARNLRGRRFPCRAPDPELVEIAGEVESAARAAWPEAKLFGSLTEAEFDYLLGVRLVSPDFAYRRPGRALLLAKDCSVGVMVNEEDHLRIQAVTAGWSVDEAEALGLAWVGAISERLSFAHHPVWGFLTASPTNVGDGRRWSVLFHLIGLAHSGRLRSVLTALLDRGMEVRGLYGEASRAVGAFFQVSARRGARAEFQGACEYLVREEQRARREVRREELVAQSEKSRNFVVASREMALGGALKALGWLRWAAAAELPGFAFSPRDVDRWVSVLEVRGAGDARAIARQRAAFLRDCLGV